MYQPGPVPSNLPPNKVCTAVSNMHPMPWTYFTTPTGQVVVVDSLRREVNLFALADFSVAASHCVEPIYNQSAPTAQQTKESP